MRYLYKKDGKWECYAGSKIEEAVADAIRIADEERKVIEFDFNGILVGVAQYSDPKAVIGAWHRKNREREDMRKLNKMARGSSQPLRSGFFNEQLAKQLDEAVQRRMQFIDENRSKLIEAFIAETGLKPSECAFAEQRTHTGEIFHWVMRRENQPLVDTAPVIYMLRRGDSEQVEPKFGFFTDKDTAELLAEATGHFVVEITRKFIGNPL